MVCPLILPYTGLNCRAKWFSAIDFKLEKIK